MAKSIEEIKKFIKIAEEMLERGETDTCMNRLYISCENAAEILLRKYSAEMPKRHDKIANALENLFKTGKLEKDFSFTLRRLYDLHMRSDYGKEIGEETSKEEIVRLLEEAKSLLQAAR